MKHLATLLMIVIVASTAMQALAFTPVFVRGLMMTDDRAHSQVILTPAADAELRRQRAVRASDATAETAALIELAKLHEAYPAAEAAQATQSASR